MFNTPGKNYNSYMFTDNHYTFILIVSPTGRILIDNLGILPEKHRRLVKPLFLILLYSLYYFIIIIILFILLNYIIIILYYIIFNYI